MTAPFPETPSCSALVSRHFMFWTTTLVALLSPFLIVGEFSKRCGRIRVHKHPSPLCTAVVAQLYRIQSRAYSTAHRTAAVVITSTTEHKDRPEAVERIRRREG